jgi:oxalate---CoA ligase
MSSKEQVNLSDVFLEKELLGMWRRLLKNDNVTIDGDFFEWGGDSLLAIELLFEVEQLTGRSLPSSIIFETGTVRQLLKRVIATDKDQPHGSVLVGSEQGEIVHHFHGDFQYGGGGNFNTLYKMLGSDYRIHAIPPHLPHEGKLPNSIEGMAKERLQKILKEQPNGPYVLLGTCIGALVGFESARLLVSMGKEVKAVVMVDPLIMSVRRSAQFIFTAADLVMRPVGIQKNKRRTYLLRIYKELLRIDRRAKDFWHHPQFFFQKTGTQRRLWKKNSPSKKRSPESKNIQKHYLNALFDYKPLSLNVPLLYVSLEYSGDAWRRITKDAVFINIFRGRHVPWSETYAPYVVDKIREFINR